MVIYHIYLVLDWEIKSIDVLQSWEWEKNIEIGKRFCATSWYLFLSTLFFNNYCGTSKVKKI